MKNLTRFLLFGGTLLLLMFLTPLMAQCQEVAPASPGLFARIGDWFAGNAIQAGILIASAVLTQYGITKWIKAAARKGAVIFSKVSHAAGDIATLCNTVDQSIKDDDSIDQNSIKEVIEAGKQVVVEMKDMKAVFTPK